MSITPTEIAAREPVWGVLSELYLDAELDDAGLAPMAAVLARSPYSIAELRSGSGGNGEGLG